MGKFYYPQIAYSEISYVENGRMSVSAVEGECYRPSRNGDKKKTVITKNPFSKHIQLN